MYIYIPYTMPMRFVILLHVNMHDVPQYIATHQSNEFDLFFGTPALRLFLHLLKENV